MGSRLDEFISATRDEKSTMQPYAKLRWMRVCLFLFCHIFGFTGTCLFCWVGSILISAYL